ncbi:MAG: GspE/PulE family protein [Treponema sp.]|nr:GspE/PulE family protein [Treponema sp.]MCL2272694.1 GspE/PulE family protein [Treponema sp.]
MLNDDNNVLKIRIKKTFPDYNCSFRILNSDDFNLKLSRLLSDDFTDEQNLESIKNNNRKSIIDKIEGDAPVINLLNSIFLEAISMRASDIHIESGSVESIIRYRIDGLLVDARRISQERSNAVSARLKILANLNMLEIRRPQDGHLDVRSDAYSLDVRISIVPTIWGESIVLRLLNRSDSPFTLDSLGFSKQHMDCINKIIETSSGLILLTGPTGSGKTTTLAAILKELNKNNIKIISIEEPVEYRIEGITQIQVNDELGLTFDTLLRRIFRQDPDVIMIGEIRDVQTAELAVRAALTGHLVFATLHTNNAIEAVYRLQNMGIPAYMAAAVLRMVAAQRLVRKQCPYCKTSGCSMCNNTGYSGRTVIAEFIPVTQEFSDLIAVEPDIEKLRSYLKKKPFTTLSDDAKEKIAFGITTEIEVKHELGDN